MNSLLRASKPRATMAIALSLCLSQAELEDTESRRRWRYAPCGAASLRNTSTRIHGAPTAFAAASATSKAPGRRDLTCESMALAHSFSPFHSGLPWKNSDLPSG